MSRNVTSPVGALHPILFFLVVYSISLFLAFFVCRTVYYTIHGNPASELSQQVQKDLRYSPSTLTATAYK